ncbi:MAG: hypothetical protein HYR74_06630 [Candidatus Eisenbacteria bacterium]|nr:hypothetical protein [Candidatus Eisenbacteria bacterium]
MRGTRLVMVALLMVAWGAGAVAAQRVATVKPQFLPPGELARALGVRERDGRGVLEWRAGADVRTVDVRRNDAANLIVLTGESEDVDAAEAMVKALDVAPRQILIEARIVEIDLTRARQLGMDWRTFDDVSYQRNDLRDYRVGPDFKDSRALFQNRFFASADFAALQQNGVATTRDAPRVLTLNNRAANILDGQRVTYITRYSSYTNLFQTDTLDAGLALNVTPSLGESGYLTLDVRAELTQLVNQISGSPVKDGQIVENTVVMKDGDTVLLGGFERTADVRQRTGLPLLGRVLPFLFSRESTTHRERESFVALTARVVDTNAGPDPKTREIFEGTAPGPKR